MAYFLRLIPRWAWFAFGCLLAAVPQFAFADYYYPASGTITYSIFGNSRSTPSEACAATGSGARTNGNIQYNGCYLNGTSFVGSIASSGGTCPGTRVGLTRVGDVTYSASVPPQDVPGKVAYCRYTGSPSCVSPNVFDPVTGTCVPPADPCSENAGKWWSEGYGWNSMFPVENFGSGEGDSLPDTGCVQGCTVTYDRSSGGYGSGRYWFVATAKATGESCTTTQPQPPAPDTGPKTPETSPEYDCAKSGQGWGTVNGTVICTGPATTQTTKDKETTKTTNPDSTTTETTKETTCTGGTCTETTTTTNCDASGNNCTSSTSTSTKTGTGEAEEEGGEPASKWGGNCAGGFACSGDAIQCAIAKEQHIRNCELEPSQANKDRGQNVIDGVLEANDPRRPENKASEAFGNWTAEGGMSGSCPADFSVQMYGQTIVVPWSDLCPHFNAMGYAMLAVAWVIAASVLRGVL